MLVVFSMTRPSCQSAITRSTDWLCLLFGLLSALNYAVVICQAETLSTLVFASRCMRVQSNPVRHEEHEEMEVTTRQEIPSRPYVV